MDYKRTLGLSSTSKFPDSEREKLHLYINLKLASSGHATCISGNETEFLETARDLLLSYREKNRLLATHQCPVDQRIQDFINRYLDTEITPQLPTNTFVLDRHGVARELSLPIGEDEFHSDIVSSYRVKQGVLHNPASDRRTTKGSFHIADGGLPIPGDKTVVPKAVFGMMLAKALAPPADLMTLPFSSNQKKPARTFVSLLMRPVVCPEIPGTEPQKTMETRFFAPGNLVCNLDFVESIFGNGGNPSLPQFDAALDVEHWTGHTGCVILAPHLTGMSKQSLGLPHWDDATEEQKKSGMCWQQADEPYNDGQAFKITARDESGVIITLLADNYFGYCKKEVKTQIGFSANLFGLAEEEHAGGALAFQRRNHGEEYGVDSVTREAGYSFEEMATRYGELMTIMPEGYGIDKQYPHIIYLPQNLRMDLIAQRITWQTDDGPQSIRLQPDKTYIQPNGYKIEMKRHPGAPSWRLIGTEPEGTLCHKPSTVSGGGKSEISKDIDDAVVYGSMFVDDLDKDLDRIEEILSYDYSHRYLPGYENEDRDPSRQPLSTERSLGSVIKLLTPSPIHIDAYNDWLDSIPPRILALLFVLKRFYHTDWGDNWREHLSVDEIDGAPGHELKLDNRTMVGTYQRVGFDQNNEWRLFKVRQDYIPAEKIQMEDDITASAVASPESVAACQAGQRKNFSVKLVHNCEYRLFQRPDDAIIPGYDKQTEMEMASSDNFLANYEPLKGQNLSNIVEDVLTFCNYTPLMKLLLQDAYNEKDTFVVSSAHPRLVEDGPSKNPRYLQTRQDLINPQRSYVANIGARLHRKLELDEPLCHPVNAVLCGRRNNPPEEGIRGLAVYNPIHYQELPELFMDFVCSLTGKSPSTTGAGSEGALTKGPFNALRATADLNNALVALILTGYDGFSSSAGYVGPDVRVDHDVSLLIPEIWARLKPEEQTAEYMIEKDFLEPLQDFDHQGQTVLASRLGYRITDRFVSGVMGKLFDNPSVVFTDNILKPELQDLDVYVDGINNIVEAQRKVAQDYINDGSIDDACPPLKALLYIMATGSDVDMNAHSDEFRAMFTREALLSSDWYQERLEMKQSRDVALWKKHIGNLTTFLDQPGHAEEAEKLNISQRLKNAESKLKTIQSPDYLHSLVGTIGADPLRPAATMAAQWKEKKGQKAA